MIIMIIMIIILIILIILIIMYEICIPNSKPFQKPMAYILIQRAQKRHNLIEKPLKMADFVQYLLWRPYAKIY